MDNLFFLQSSLAVCKLIRVIRQISQASSPNKVDLNWLEELVLRMREAASLLSVSFACKHACVCEASAGRATDSEEECQVDCGWGCLAR